MQQVQASQPAILAMGKLLLLDLPLAMGLGIPMINPFRFLRVTAPG